MRTNQEAFLFLLCLNVLGSIFRVLAKMVTRLCLRGCSGFFILAYRRFRIFAILLGVLSLVSFALVFHRMARTMSYKAVAYQIGVAITKTKTEVNLRDIKENITNSNAACKLPVLDPFHSSVIHFMKDLGKLRCSGVSYSSFENNMLRVEGEGVISAQYRKIDRTPGKDFGVVLSDPVAVQNTGERTGTLLINYEALALLCCEIFSGVRLARLPLLQCAMLLCGRKLKIEDRN